MPIPSTTRKPGNFLDFDILSARRGLAPVDRNLAIVGAHTSAATKAAETPFRVLSESEADTFFGKGSEVALGLRAAIKAAALAGKGPALYGVGIAEAAGVAAVDKYTITGSATVAGSIVFKIAGRTLSAGVEVGDTVTTMALSMKAAVDAMLSDLPVTAGAALGVMSITANHTGVLGNDLIYTAESAPAGVTVTPSNTTVGTGSYDITNALDSLVDKHYHGIAIGNHLAADVTDLAAHITAMALPGTKKWVRTFLAETGTLSTATALATSADSQYQSVITAEDFPNLPIEVAATVAATEEGEEDVALPFDDVILPLFLPPEGSVPTDPEIEVALAAGATILGVTTNGTKAKIIKSVTTKTTDASAPFYEIAEVEIARTLIQVGIQVDIAWSIAFPQSKKSQRTKDRVKSVTLRVLRAMESLEQLQNVDARLGELIVEDDLIVASRLNVDIPASVIVGNHQRDGTIRLFLE